MEFKFQADMQTLQFQALPMDTLRAVAFERLSIVGRPLNLVVTLTQVVQSLDESIAKRNTLIDGYKTEFAKDNQGFVQLYFGLPYGEGHVNLDYPGTINAIYSQTDDGIFFVKTCTSTASNCQMYSRKNSRTIRLASVRSTSLLLPALCQMIQTIPTGSRHL